MLISSLILIIIGICFLLVKKFGMSDLNKDPNCARRKQREVFKLNFVSGVLILGSIFFIIIAVFFQDEKIKDITNFRILFLILSLGLVINGVIILLEKLKYFMNLEKRGYKIAQKLINETKYSYLIGFVLLILTSVLFYLSNIWQVLG